MGRRRLATGRRSRPAALWAAVLLLASSLVLVGSSWRPAAACSFAPPPPLPVQLAAADLAFVGQLVDQEPLHPVRLQTRQPRVVGADGAPPGAVDGPVTVRFRYEIERVVKGSLGPELVLERVYSAHPCGPAVTPAARLGVRTGVLVSYPHGFGEPVISEVPAEELVKAADPLRPDPRAGHTVAVLTGALGTASLVGIDRDGRVSALASGPGWPRQAAPCPGGRRAVEVSESTGPPYTYDVVVRRLPDLAELRRVPLPGSRPEHSLAADDGGSLSVACGDDNADEILFFASAAEGDSRTGRIIRLLGSAARPLGPALPGPVAFAPRSRYAYAATGHDRDQLVRVDLDSGRTAPVATLTPVIEHLSASPDESAVAAVVGAGSSFDVVSVEVAANTVRRAPMGRSGGPPTWIDDEHLFLAGEVRDRYLGVVRSHDWWDFGSAVAAADGALYGVTASGVVILEAPVAADQGVQVAYPFVQVLGVHPVASVGDRAARRSLGLLPVPVALVALAGVAVALSRRLRQHGFAAS